MINYQWLCSGDAGARVRAVICSLSWGSHCWGLEETRTAGGDACTLERTAATEGGTVRPEKSAPQLSAQTPEWGGTGPRMCARLCWCTGEQKASLSFIYKKYTRFILQTRLLKFITVAHSKSWCQLFKQRRLKPSWTHQSFLCREKQYKSRACIFLLGWEQWFLCFIPW